MRRFLNYALIPTVLLGLVGVSLAEEVKTTESKIIIVNSAEKYIGLNLDGKHIEIHTDEKTRITEGGRDIQFSDLDVGDKVEINYVKEEGFMGLGEDFLAKKIKVAKVKTEGTGKVLFVEPATKSISIVIDNTPLVIGINKDTTFKGVENLAGVEKNDKVFVDYKIGEHGKKILVLLKKKSP